MHYFLFLLLLLPLSALCSQEPLTDRLRDFSKNEIWLKVLHYRDGRSEVITPEFFLSPHGNTNPLEELIATIEAFSTSSNADNTHPACIFPARKMLLEEHLHLQFLTPSCSKYTAWKNKTNAHSISLLFATGYLDNPASYYGHILLKFNSQKPTPETDLLDNSLNFGALDTQTDNIIKYIYKGLLGGYHAAFSDQQFYRHNLAYGEAQLRDIWEYRLNLEPDQVELVVAHTWELLPVKFKYYFLKQNCAYRMAELLEIVTEKELISKVYPFAIPYSVFDNASSNENGASLVQSIEHMPSRQKKLSIKMNQLSPAERRLVIKLIKNDFQPERTSFSVLSDERKAYVLELLIDYYQFLGAKNDDPDHSLKIKNRVYRERYRLKPSITDWTSARERPPHSSTKPSMLQLAVKEKNKAIGYAIRYRPAYYDFLTPDHARLRNSKLIAMELGIELIDNNVSIEKFELLDIHTLNTSFSGLPQDGGAAWQMNLSYKSLFEGCESCKTSQATFGVGFSRSMANITPYIMIKARVHGDELQSGNYSTQAELGAIVNLNSAIRVHATSTRSHYDGNTDVPGDRHEISIRFFESKSWDIRTRFVKEQRSLAELSFAYYF